MHANYFEVQKSLQEEIVCSAGAEAFELGLFTAVESSLMEEEPRQTYGFQHLMFQEFLAGKFAATLDMVSVVPTRLEEPI